MDNKRIKRLRCKILAFLKERPDEIWELSAKLKSDEKLEVWQALYRLGVFPPVAGKKETRPE